MRILISDNMEEEVVEKIRKLGDVEYKPQDLEKAIGEADIMIVRSATRVTEKLLGNAKKLKLVIRAGVGTDNIDKEACKKRDIEVKNTPRASTNAVAELALGLIICGLRNVQKGHYQMKNKEWRKKELVGNEIEGKTLGIIGYGRIGSSLGTQARQLGMKTIAYNPPPRHDDGAIVFVESFDEFHGQCDVISLHAPLTDKTKDMINKESIAKMKDEVFIVNTARGELIDEDALYEGCRSGKIKGAALDVYKKEPYKGKLLELDNVYFTPHIAGNTKEAQTRIGEQVVRIIEEF